MQKSRLMVIYGSDPMNMAYDIMTKADVKSMLDKSMKIALKPNLVVAKPSNSGATTSPELVEGVIKYLKDNEFDNITIMESSWIGESTMRAYKACGYDRISSKYNVPLVDLKKDSSSTFTHEGISIKICNAPLEADFLINMPVLKAHCQTLITCALKNMKGCVPDSEKRHFHALGLHTPIALLNKFLKPDLTLVDGIMGDLTFEEGGNPVQMNRVILGADPVLVDAYAAKLLGYATEDIAYIVEAEQLGVGSSRIDDSTVFELNKDSAPSGNLTASRKAVRLSGYINEKQACSACYGSLIHALNRLDDRGMLHRLKDKIHIGQGYKGGEADGIGIGLCTSGFSNNLKGCPPSAREIVDFLAANIL